MLQEDNSVESQSQAWIAGNTESTEKDDRRQSPFGSLCPEIRLNSLRSAPRPNPLRDSTLELLREQFLRGFRPQWMLTFHYGNPYERGWRVAEKSPRWGYKIPGNRSLMMDVGVDNAITRRRNDEILVSRDATHIRNLLLRSIWNIKRLDSHDASSTPMIFFHELGRERLQYHTHLLIANIPSKYNNSPSLLRLWHESIRPKETLDNPASPRDNGSVIAGHGWFHGRQAARIR